MWKYVSRRIRDVCDRTYNVLDVRRPWQCGGERFCAENNLPGADQHQQQQDDSSKLQQRAEGPTALKNGSYCLLNVVNKQLDLSRNDGKQKQYDTGSNSSSEEEGFRRKEYCSFQHNWIGAITWSGAIIWGWYTSQLICLYRRHHKWDGPKCLPFLITSAHRIPCEFKSFPFSVSPPLPPPTFQHHEQKQQQQSSGVATFLGVPIPTGKASLLSEYDFLDSSIQQKNFVFEINNDGRQQTKDDQHVIPANEERALPLPEPSIPTVESAMKNLMSTIGEIEFQLGVQNLEIGDYQTAISHLKLGTSHQHAGAAFNLGICYEQGFGVRKNARVAMECFHLASTLGHAEATYNLGVYYARGLGGLRRSRSMAKKCFVAAAELGLEQAIAALGPSYRPSARSPSEAASAPSFEIKLNYDDEENYGRFEAMKPAANQPDQFELRLVSAMA